MKSASLRALFGIILGSGACLCQANFGEGAPVSDAEILERYHVSMTRDGLAAALRQPNSGVRAQAALALAGKEEKGTAPAILSALSAEAFPGARIALALSAGILGADDGVVALRDMCGDPAWAPGLRMSAANAMLYLRRDDCLGSVLDVLRLHEDDQAVVSALCLLGRFQHVTADQAVQIRELISASLKSEGVTVRFYASRAFPQFGDYASLYALQGALAVEREDGVRKAIADAIKLLAQRLTAKR